MKKMITKFGFITLLLLSPLSANSLFEPSGQKDLKSGLAIATMMINGESIRVEIADTPDSQATGLMNRLMLPKNSGMLFLFSNSDYRSFWMKNTKIPLDIIYIKESGEIANIVQAKPCINDPCPSYPSRHPVKYVLELAKGEAERLGIKVGDSLILEEEM